MSLQKAYIRFMNHPKSSALSSDSSSLNYVTTTLSVSGEAMIKHLRAQANLLEKKSEKVLSAIETTDSLVLETETTLEFKINAGNFLPGLDDNFLVDHIVTFPMVHVVNFRDGLISQIRLYWDQGTLLKQIGVIGRSGRNWPIRIGQEQCKLIQTSVTKVSIPSTGVTAGQSEEHTRHRGDSNVSNASSTSTSSLRPTPDPHATLSLFTPQESTPEVVNDSTPKADQKGVPRKAPASFSRGRGFDILNNEDHVDQESEPSTPSQGKANPRKFSHFEFSDEHASNAAVPPVFNDTRTKSNWDFADFSTPEKKPLKMRRDDIRSFSWSDDEDNEDGSTPRGSSNGAARREAASHAQRDVDHFMIADQSPANPNTVPADRKAAVKSMSSQRDAEVEQLGGGKKTIYRTSGDGMGGRKASGSDEVKRAIYKTAGDGMGGRKGLGGSIWGTDDDLKRPDVRRQNTRASGTASGALKTRGAKENQPSELWDF